MRYAIALILCAVSLGAGRGRDPVELQADPRFEWRSVERITLNEKQLRWLREVAIEEMGPYWNPAPCETPTTCAMQSPAACGEHATPGSFASLAVWERHDGTATCNVICSDGDAFFVSCEAPPWDCTFDDLMPCHRCGWLPRCADPECLAHPEDCG